MSPINDTIQNLLGRGVVEVVDAERLAGRLKRGKPLRVKFGIDPTSHHIHIGHAVVLRKLRAFQRAGHQAVLIIGDFTARIGDPSGRDSERPALSKKQTESFAETYLAQAGKIIDLKKAEIHHNSEWLDKFTPADFLHLLSTMTIQQLLAHETFGGRVRDGQPVGAHEMIYPLLQGYDSVAVRADVELGGMDQKFNLLVGRDVQKAFEMDQQDVILCDYLMGTDGKKKMSKSLGNTINLTDSAEDIFGKVMSIPDKLIGPYYELATDLDEVAIAQVKKQLRAKNTNPRDIKAALATEIVGQLFTPAETEAAGERFTRVHRQHELPSTMPEIALRPGVHHLIDVLISQKIVASRSEARRLIEQGGVRLDRQQITSWEAPVTMNNGSVLEVGKRRFYRIRTSA